MLEPVKKKILNSCCTGPGKVDITPQIQHAAPLERDVAVARDLRDGDAPDGLAVDGGGDRVDADAAWALVRLAGAGALLLASSVRAASGCARALGDVEAVERDASDAAAGGGDGGAAEEEPWPPP